MIKKAALLLTAPFLMVFSFSAFSNDAWQSLPLPDDCVPQSGNYYCAVTSYYSLDHVVYQFDECEIGTSNVDRSGVTCRARDLTSGFYFDNPTGIPAKSDSECQTQNGDSLTVPTSSANFLNGGGSFTTHGGACSVTGAGGISACNPETDTCSINISSTSTGNVGTLDLQDNLNSGIVGVPEPETPPIEDEPDSSYLTPLEGGSFCTTSESCVNIGDQGYIVDWSTAPDYFSYTDSSGNIYTNPNTGGGDTGDGDKGGSDSGGSTGGGSTVPDFEFDESGIIEAIRSSGQSNRNSIDALSNDVTGAISNQTSQLNASTTQQTQALTEKINAETSRLITESDNQTGRVTTAIKSQTQSVQNTLDTQTGSLNSSINDLKTSLVDAFGNIKVRFSGGSSSGSGSSDGEGEDDEEVDGVDGFLDTLVDKLASKFTEDLGSDDDLFDSSGMDETLDGIAEEEAQHTEDVQGLMDEIGEDDSSGIADQVASLIPSLPSGSCTPMAFGPMEISCQAFNTIKAWLTWIVYFWTVVSIVDIFFRSETRAA